MRIPIFLLKRAYLETRKALDHSLEKYGLTAAQLDVLMHLWLNDGMEHRVLQERLGVSSPTLTSVIDVMVEHGLVERRTSAEDARVKQLFLTQRGRQMSDDLTEENVRFNAKMLAGFTPNEVALFSDWLERVARNVSGVAGE